MSKRVARTEQIVNPEGNTRVDLVGAIAVGLGIPLYNLLFVLPSFGHITSEFVVFVLTNSQAHP